MTENKSNIALLLGDPAGIGPELISKLLNDEMTKKANIVIIGEKQVFESREALHGEKYTTLEKIDFEPNQEVLDLSHIFNLTNLHFSTR